MTALAVERSHVRLAPETTARDERWFADFYRTTFDSAFRFAMMLTHDHHLAEEVVAEAYARAWKHRLGFTGGSDLSWLFATIRNRAVDEFRLRRGTVDLDRIPEKEDQPPSVLAELAPEHVAALRDAITRLTEEQQQVIFLRFYEGLPHDTVAERLGKNGNAVRAIQFRALLRLRRILMGARNAQA